MIMSGSIVHILNLKDLITIFQMFMNIVLHEVLILQKI